jgi:hypothetical protein
MAHLTKISAGKFTSLAYATAGAVNSASTDAAIAALFTSGTFPTTDVAVETLATAVPLAVGDVREFPSVGTPANVVNVPVYGQSTSSQVAGQSDAPTLEFTLNYVASKHAALEALRKAGTKLAFRVRLSDAAPSTVTLGVARNKRTDEFSDFYFLGTIASFEISTNLTDAIQATIALTVDGDFRGPLSLKAGVTTGYLAPA